MPRIEVVSSYEEPGSVNKYDDVTSSALKNPSNHPTAHIHPPPSSIDDLLSLTTGQISLEEYVHKMSNLLIDIEKDMKSSSFSEIQRNNLCLSASRQVDEIVSQLRLSWQHNRVLCALLSKLTVIFEGSYSVSDTTGKSRKEMWSNVFYIVERVAERGRVEEAGLSVEERVEFYKLLEKSPVEVIKAKNLMR